MIVYLDSSIWVKLLVAEAFSDEARRIWSAASAIVCAEVAFVEVRAALAAAHRDGRLTDAAWRTGRLGLERLWRQVAVVAIGSDLVRRAAGLAEQHALRGYDAVHLAAAQSGAAEVLATADRRLARAAGELGMAVAGPTP